MQRAQRRRLLCLVLAHPAEQAVERVDAGENVLALVEHDAFGACRHGGVCHLATRCQSGLHQVFQDLGRPDCGDVCGLADPQDLFLHLGDARESHLHGKVATRDHDAERLARRALHDDLWQIVNRARGFDLGNERKLLPIRAAPCEFLLKIGDIVGGLDEGIPDHVGVEDDEVEILPVLVGQRIQPQFDAGEVEASLGLQLYAFEASFFHARHQARPDLAHDGPFELAVVD